MKEIIDLIDKYWKFDEDQQPLSTWHDKQELLELVSNRLEKLGYSEGAPQPGDGADIEFYKKALERIANEIGIFSPLQMMARVENDNETYVDILIKILKEKLDPASL